MKRTVWILIAVLLLLYHDYWFWNDARLVFGIFPVGLFYHMCLSIAATLVWLYCVFFAWPESSDSDFAGERDGAFVPGKPGEGST